MNSEIRQRLRQIFDEVRIELGPPFDHWRITPVEPDFRADRGYPELCYWVYDQRDKAHAFSFPDRPDQPNLDWLRPELRRKLLMLAGSTQACMEWGTAKPTEPGRYHFRGKLHHKDGSLRSFSEPIEVEVLTPERAVYHAFMAIGDSEIPSMPIKQFIRTVDQNYVGEAERWDGEWALSIESPKG